MNYEQAIKYLTDHRSLILDMYNVVKHPAAVNVVALHRMHVACPNDPGAIGLLIGATEELEKVIDEYEEKEAARRNRSEMGPG